LGNIYLTTYSWYSEGSGHADSTFIIKLNASGNEIWRKYILKDFMINDIIFMNSNLYVAGKFRDTIQLGNNIIESSGQYDGFLAKFDANGNCLWVKQFGGKENDFANSLCFDSQNNIWLTGGYADTAVFSSTSLVCQGDMNMFISKYDINGNLLNIKSAGGTQSIGRKIRCGVNDNLYILGEWNDMQLGTFYLPNCSCSPYGDPEFLTLIDKYGVVQWLNGTLRESDTYITTDLVIDQNGFAYTTGCANWNDAHLYVNKFGLAGQKQWSRTMDRGYGCDFVSGSLATTNDFLYVAAYAGLFYYGNSNPTGGNYLLMEKLDLSGALMQIDTILVTGYIIPRSMYYNVNADHFLIDGYYYGGITLGNDSINGMNGNVFISKFIDGVTTSISETLSKDGDISLYPNPSTGMVMINLNQKAKSKICIHDVLGNCIMHKEYQNEENLSIDLSNQAKGIYFLEVIMDDKRSVKKVVLQ
jgi:hypothetical protein